jgi:hypothetical protein
MKSLQTPAEELFTLQDADCKFWVRLTAASSHYHTKFPNLLSSENATLVWPQFSRENMRLILSMNEEWHWRAFIIYQDNSSASPQVLVDTEYNSNYATPDTAAMSLLTIMARKVDRKFWQGSESEVSSPGMSGT